ncbi:MAG TPA: hypothetical protein VE954_42655 [Oligoflexus sp.]|uniref:hypothetical protein n=1 Tax=Oligoflexus sp. TaxID=1971216 RepID=UPI002D2AA4D7|nr:hypothetical protein [Oligoflexus sp.]HYX39844.1 hypothetical protein [Oligoflexus sp.]
MIYKVLIAIALIAIGNQARANQFWSATVIVNIEAFLCAPDSGVTCLDDGSHAFITILDPLNPGAAPVKLTMADVAGAYNEFYALQNNNPKGTHRDEYLDSLYWMKAAGNAGKNKCSFGSVGCFASAALLASLGPVGIGFGALGAAACAYRSYDCTTSWENYNMNVDRAINEALLCDASDLECFQKALKLAKRPISLIPPKQLSGGVAPGGLGSYSGSGTGSTGSMGPGGSPSGVGGESYKCVRYKVGDPVHGYDFQTICGWG